MTSGVTGSGGSRPAGRSESQTGGFSRGGEGGGVQPSQPLPGLPQPFGAQLGPKIPGRSARLRVVGGGRESLLSVGEVAERLGVSRATVYALVERGELAHVRVSNAIRVAPADLAAYLERGRRR